MPVVLFSAPYMIPFLDRFQPLFDSRGINLILPEVEERLEEDQILAYAGEFDGVICGDDRFSREVIEACLPRLKVISKWGTGIDSIDREACRELGVQLGNTPGAFTEAVADSVLGYVLCFARMQPWMDQEIKGGSWQKIPGRALHECTLGVIGIGTIGRAVVKRCQPFGMKVLGNDIQKVDPAFQEEYQLEMVSLEVLLSRADFVSVNCDLNPSSFKLINPGTLALMKPQAVLINTARGPIVDEQALIQALEAGELAGAALDVYEFEPLPPESPLRGFPNVLLAPHNANSSPAAWERVHWNTIRNLFDGLGVTYQQNERGEVI
jgi:D-3-phosphoglycerate dehydrogenase